MTAVPKQPTYFAGLDGIRAVSVMIVFVAHAGLGHVVPGGFGVTVFFFLSGFLITSLLIREQDTYGWIALGAFFQRRVVRLLPPVLVTIGLGVVAVWLGYAQGNLDFWTLFSQIFFYFNYYSQTDASSSTVSGLNILWSLSVEEQFYLIFPLWFIALAASRWQIPSVVFVIGLTLVWRIIRFEVFGHSHESIYISTDTRIDSILYGCLLAMVSQRYPQYLTFILKWRYIVFALAIAALITSFLWRDPMFRATFRYSLQGIALFPLFYMAVNLPQTRLFGWLNWAPLRRLGQYSYTFYLGHFVIIQMLIFNGVDQNNIAVLMPCAFVLSTLYAGLVYRFLEKPMHPLRARLSGHS